MAKNMNIDLNCKEQSDSLEKIFQSVPTIPAQPGCYLWKGNVAGQETVLYVGKSISLRSRVRQYFKSTDYKTQFLMQRVSALDWVVTQNELEALLLENTLIKKHKPPYNIRLKDDKAYPYLCLSMGEPFPRLFLTRKKTSREHIYFGPFTDVRAARSTMALLHKVFPIRKRPLRLPLKNPAKPCLNFHMSRCWAPCAGNVEEAEYREMVSEIKNFLEGNGNQVQERLEHIMEAYSLKREYEKAARIRNVLSDIEATQKEQNVQFFTGESDFDVIGVYSINRDALLQELALPFDALTFSEQSENLSFGQVALLKVRNGKLISKQSYALSEGLPPDDNERSAELFETFFRDYYFYFRDIPAQITLSHKFSRVQLWEKSLSDTAGKTVSLIEPKKAHTRKNLIEIALNNARLSLSERILTEKIRNQKLGLRQIQTFLKLQAAPHIIECYDISNISGKEAVGSGVMLKDGLPFKSGYRKYKIKNFIEPNDPGMMNEVISRRMARISSGNIKKPDLIVIDGGKTQLRAAIAARKEHAVTVPMIGLAKKREEVHLENGSILSMDKNSPGMMLLRLARDEAHRFGVSYHRNLRIKRNLASILDRVKGVGHKRKIKFASEIRKISIDEFTPKTLFDYLKTKTSAPDKVVWEVVNALFEK